MPEPIRVHVRFSIRRDLPEMLAVERGRHGDDGWSEEDYLYSLRQRDTIGMVAEHGQVVAGHMLYRLHKHHLELVRLGVHPRYRRRSVGTQLIDKLASKLSSHRRTRITAAVDEYDLGVQLFLRSRGFVARPAGALIDFTYRIAADVPVEETV